MSIKEGITQTLKIILWVISALVTVGLLVTAYSGNLNPYDYPKLAVFGMSFPIFLITQILLIFGWLIFGKWKTALSLFVPVLLCAKSVFIFCPMNVFGNSVAETETKSEFKLMTYNILHFYDQHNRQSEKNLSVENVLSVDADVVCLQESSHKTNDPRITEEQHNLVKEKYPYSNFKCYDIGILSKFPIVGYSVLSRGQYSAAKYQLDIKGDTVTVFIVHLQSIGLNSKDKKLYHDIISSEKVSSKMDSVKNVFGEVKTQLYGKLKDAMQKRADQALFLRSELDKEKGRVILCGDFNDTPNSFAYRTVKGDMTDAYVDCGFGPCITYNASSLYFRIDHVFYNGKIEAVDVQRPKFDASDHYPLVVDFVIKK